MKRDNIRTVSFFLNEVNFMLPPLYRLLGWRVLIIKASPTVTKLAGILDRIGGAYVRYGIAIHLSSIDDLRSSILRLKMRPA